MSAEVGSRDVTIADRKAKIPPRQSTTNVQGLTSRMTRAGCSSKEFDVNPSCNAWLACLVPAEAR